MFLVKGDHIRITSFSFSLREFDLEEFGKKGRSIYKKIEEIGR